MALMLAFWFFPSLVCWMLFKAVWSEIIGRRIERGEMIAPTEEIDGAFALSMYASQD